MTNIVRLLSKAVRENRAESEEVFWRIIQLQVAVTGRVNEIREGGKTSKGNLQMLRQVDTMIKAWLVLRRETGPSALIVDSGWELARMTEGVLSKEYEELKYV